MHCRRCGNPLEKPGDYCLTCNTANRDAVVAVFAADHATLTFLDDEDVLGGTTITTMPESDDETRVVQLRSFTGLIADGIRRRRPETVYVAGKRAPLREMRTQLHYESYHVSDDDPAQRVLDTHGKQALEVVDIPPAGKLGGSHSTLIDGRRGHRAIGIVAGHLYVRKVIPDPVGAGGTRSQAGLRTRVTRADGNRSVRLLLRDGSGAQENRIVTTTTNRETGKHAHDDLNEALREDGLQDK